MYYNIKTLTSEELEAVLDEVFSNIFGACYG